MALAFVPNKTTSMAIPKLDDEPQLLEKISMGDGHAFTLLFNHYQGFVYGFGKKLTHSEEMAVDIVQDVFMKIWEGRAQLVTIDSFGACLNRLVRNHAFNLLRDLSAKARSVVSLDGVEVPEQSTLYQLDYNETLRLVNQAVDGLSPQQRQAYQLCHGQGMKYEEAAQQMGISPQTLHVHMKQALKKIREHLRHNAIAYPLLVMVILK